MSLNRQSQAALSQVAAGLLVGVPDTRTTEMF
jgi:hypothetical protein